MTESEIPKEPRRGRRTVRVVATTAGAIVLVGGAAAAAVGLGGKSDASGSRSPLPPATAAVTKGTLASVESVDGTLGYGDLTTVSARTTGTVTWLPDVGGQIDQGRPVYRVDDKPVVLLYGTIPLYRVLKPGISGPDVHELEDNLAALGYSGFTVDDDYDFGTATAVNQWRSDLNQPQNGQVEVSSVAVAAGPIRVNEQKAHVGDPATGPIITYTGTSRAVYIALDVSKQQLVKPGLAVKVTLPDDETVPGNVSEIGTVAHSKTTGVGSNANTTTTIDVTVAITDQTKLGTLDQAPVTVDFISEQHADVLSVPVVALLALSEGGYGVQIVDGDTTHIVAVRVGLFANGRVEIVGDGIEAGTIVGIPK